MFETLLYEILGHLLYLFVCLKYCCMSGKQCRPRSGATVCFLLSGSTLFAQPCLSENLGSKNVWIENEHIKFKFNNTGKAVTVAKFRI